MIHHPIRVVEMAGEGFVLHLLGQETINFKSSATYKHMKIDYIQEKLVGLLFRL